MNHTGKLKLASVGLLLSVFSGTAFAQSEAYSYWDNLPMNVMNRGISNSDVSKDADQMPAASVESNKGINLKLEISANPKNRQDISLKGLMKLDHELKRFVEDSLREVGCETIDLGDLVSNDTGLEVQVTSPNCKSPNVRIIREAARVTTTQECENGSEMKSIKNQHGDWTLRNNGVTSAKICVTETRNFN